jgi:hypothetical protein
MAGPAFLLFTKEAADSLPETLPATIREVTAGFEPAIGVLQTPALPLGHVTFFYGAEDEIRTRDPLLGKEMLYR